MIHHIWGVCSSYEIMPKGVMVSFDFSNVFYTVGLPSLGHTSIRCLALAYENGEGTGAIRPDQ